MHLSQEILENQIFFKFREMLENKIVQFHMPLLLTPPCNADVMSHQKNNITYHLEEKKGQGSQWTKQNFSISVSRLLKGSTGYQNKLSHLLTLFDIL